MGMPFISTWEECVNHCKTTKNFQQMAIHCLLVSKGEVLDRPNGNDSVHEDDTHLDRTTAEYDGHTWEYFVHLNNGCSPTEAGPTNKATIKTTTMNKTYNEKEIRSCGSQGEASRDNRGH